MFFPCCLMSLSEMGIVDNIAHLTSFFGLPQGNGVWVWPLINQFYTLIIGDFRGWRRHRDLHDFICVNPGKALIFKTSFCQMSNISKGDLSSCSKSTNTAQTKKLFKSLIRSQSTIRHFPLKGEKQSCQLHVFDPELPINIITWPPLITWSCRSWYQQQWRRFGKQACLVQ